MSIQGDIFPQSSREFNAVLNILENYFARRDSLESPHDVYALAINRNPFAVAGVI